MTRCSPCSLPSRPSVIICAPTIVGHATIKTRLIQIPIYVEAVLKRGKSYTIGTGKNVWDCALVSDLADPFILLTEEALKPGGGREAWWWKSSLVVEEQPSCGRA